ncbi:MAG: transposase [Gemmiger sp.]
MYRANQQQMSIYDYLPPYHGELVEQNRWVRLAQAIDWDRFEQEYSENFSAGGKIAIPARMAYGSLIIRAAYHATDRQTIALIRESPYLQYFLGFETFTDEVPFSSRSMERFRARIPQEKVREALRLLKSFEKSKK